MRSGRKGLVFKILGWYSAGNWEFLARGLRTASGCLKPLPTQFNHGLRHTLPWVG